ncbi:MAG TPA: hypothetical protein ENI30_09775 [Gammaproteobacteria bacterium]|nr:hypothetical protein EJJ20_19625 [Pseudomonas poae]HEC55397.1 hypothetical protein [Gammaproteobacteria bacterium]
MLFACQCHGEKPRRIGLGGKFHLPATYSVRGYGGSLTRSLGVQARFGGEGDGMNEWLKGRVEQVGANCEQSSGVVGLCTIHQCVAGLPG